MQGDRIGRIFANWLSVYNFEQFFGNYRSSPKTWATFCHCNSYVLSLTKYGLGHIVGDFFTNSSGHPGPMTPINWWLRQNSGLLVDPDIVMSGGNTTPGSNSQLIPMTNLKWGHSADIRVQTHTQLTLAASAFPETHLLVFKNPEKYTGGIRTHDS
jgi:hypothetical protein